MTTTEEGANGNAVQSLSDAVADALVRVRSVQDAIQEEVVQLDSNLEALGDPDNDVVKKARERLVDRKGRLADQKSHLGHVVQLLELSPLIASRQADLKLAPLHEEIEASKEALALVAEEKRLLFREMTLDREKAKEAARLQAEAVDQMRAAEQSEAAMKAKLAPLEERNHKLQADLEAALLTSKGHEENARALDARAQALGVDNQKLTQLVERKQKVIAQLQSVIATLGGGTADEEISSTVPVAASSAPPSPSALAPSALAPSAQASSASAPSSQTATTTPSMTTSAPTTSAPPMPAPAPKDAATSTSWSAAVSGGGGSGSMPAAPRAPVSGGALTAPSSSASKTADVSPLVDDLIRQEARVDSSLGPDLDVSVDEDPGSDAGQKPAPGPEDAEWSYMLIKGRKSPAGSHAGEEEDADA